MTEHYATRLDPVLAHTLLGTVAAAKGAVETVLAHSLDGANGESLLRMAVRRLDHLSEELRHLALGFSNSDEPFASDLDDKPVL
jgi:hypothetical protein